MDFIVLILMLVIPAIAQVYISSSYNKYKNIENDANITGFEVARKILDQNDLKDIYIVEVTGNLTDHYDPQRKVVRLSKDIFHGTSVAALSVAAHECGHAIQDKVGYTYMRVRSFIFPIVHFATGLSYFVIFLGLLMESLNVIWLGILLVGTGLIFQLVTLPVELDASKRAKKEIENLELATKEEQEGVSKMLSAAASTYLAGILSSALEIVRLILLFSNNNERRG